MNSRISELQALVTTDKKTVIQVCTDGYSKDGINVLVGIDENGRLSGIEFVSLGETPGLGSKTTLPDHTNKFQGVSGAITMDKAGEGTYIAPVTGASYSSKAVFNAVAAALAQYAEIGGAF